MGKWLATFSEERPRLAMLGLVGLLILLTDVFTVAPAFVSLSVAVLTACAWCWWLEKSTPFAPTSAP